jgi:hypothetical protein
MELVTNEQKKEVEKFLKRLGSVSEKELESMEKEGVFTGSYAVNPAMERRFLFMQVILSLLIMDVGWLWLFQLTTRGTLSLLKNIIFQWFK